MYKCLSIIVAIIDVHQYENYKKKNKISLRKENMRRSGYLGNI